MTEDTIAIVKALDRVSDELRGVRVAIEMFGQPLVSEPEEPTACTHPQDQRIDFGVTNGQDDFQCRVCDFRSVPVEVDP